jgi:hypothetical protein
MCPAVLCLLLSSLSYSAQQDRIAKVIDSSRTVALGNSVHAKARPEYDQGPVEASFKIQSIMLVTSPTAAQQKQLEQLLKQQQDPTSPNYHKWLTPMQFAERFGLSQHDLDQLTAWLRGQGFVIQSTAGGRNMVTFSGTAAAVQRAFHAEIHRYNVNGEQHFANATPLMVPSAFSGIIAGIHGINDFRMHPASHSRQGSGSDMHPDYYSGTTFPNLLAPADLATIYNIPSTLDGSGEAIAIIGRTDIFLADINDFRSGFGLPAINASSCTSNGNGVITSCNDPHFQYVLVGTDSTGKPDSIVAGDIYEADTDIEWSGAVAPNALIVYVNSPDGGIGSALSYALNPPAGTPIPAPVVSVSYGECELQALGQIFTFEPLFQQAASEGITVVSAAGDTGSAGCDYVPNSARPFAGATGGLAVSYFASSSYVVAVGGTAISLADDSYPNPATNYWSTSNGTSGSLGFGGTALQYIPEIPWNDNEEFFAYCQNPVSGDTFCSSTTNTTPGWVSITSAQTAQEDLWIYTGGGGASNCFSRSAGVCSSGNPQPAWQQHLVVPSAPAGVRWVPDVSFLASPNFPAYILCSPQNPDTAPPTYTSTCSSGVDFAVSHFRSIIGGTSVSAPVFAGMLALLNQYLAGPSSPGLGDIHSRLYSLAATTAGTANPAFHPITTGDNIVYCQGGTPSTQPSALQCPSTGPSSGMMGYTASNADPTTGYNLVAGLGSVNFNNLATAWTGSRSATTLTMSAPSATQINAGQSVTFTATLSPANALGNVNFFLNNSVAPFGTVALTSVDNGVATFTTTALPAGTDNVTAMFTGDGSYMPSPMSSAATVTVLQPKFALSSGALSVIGVIVGQSTSATITVKPENGFTGNVAFSSSSCLGLPAGATCSFNPAITSSTTAVTISTLASTPVGTSSLTIAGASGSFSNSTTVTFAVLPKNVAYSLTSSLGASGTGTLVVEQGIPGTLNLNVQSSNGFVISSQTALPVSYSCSGLPAESSCTVTPNPSNSANPALMVLTTAPTTAANQSKRTTRILYSVIVPGLLGMLLVPGARKKRPRSLQMLTLALMLAASTMWLGSCGASNSNHFTNLGTPVGIVKVTVNATTGGSSPITSSYAFTLTVTNN